MRQTNAHCTQIQLVDQIPECEQHRDLYKLVIVCHHQYEEGHYSLCVRQHSTIVASHKKSMVQKYAIQFEMAEVYRQ